MMVQRSITIIALALLSAAFMIVALACGGDEEEPVAPTSTPKPKQWDSPPAMAIDTGKSYTATFVMENGKEFVVELFASGAPITVNSFVFLARQGFYDGVTFHRVIPGFVAQGGDPSGTGGGGPGYAYENEVSPDLRHDSEGVLSMANAGVRDGKGTNGSQFFVTYTELHALDGYNADGSAKDCNVPGTSCHPVFGKVTSGMDAVKAISPRDPATATTPGDAIKTIRIDER